MGAVLSLCSVALVCGVCVGHVAAVALLAAYVVRNFVRSPSRVSLGKDGVVRSPSGVAAVPALSERARCADARRMHDYVASVIAEPAYGGGVAGAARLNDDVDGCERVLRHIVKENMMRASHVYDARHVDDADAEKLFEMHKVLSAFDLSAVGVKFSAHFNLFAGSVVALGTEKHARRLAAAECERGAFGCFALTECGAGVMSGLVVDTEAVYLRDERAFVLHSPSRESAKNWISNANTADFAVIFARVFLPANADGSGERRDVGVHGFFVETNAENRVLLPSVDEMWACTSHPIAMTWVPAKNSMRGLDNGIIRLNKLRVDEDALLDRLSSIDDLRSPGYRGVPFIRIADRLLAGRVVCSDVSLQSSRERFAVAFEYASRRSIYFTGREQRHQIDLPHINTTLARISGAEHVMHTYLRDVKRRYVAHQAKPIEGRAHAELVEAIATCKVTMPQFALDTALTYKELIGSELLFTRARHGLELDILYVTKIAEGDDRVLASKITFDRLKRVAQNPAAVARAVAVAAAHHATDALGALVSLAADEAERAASNVNALATLERCLLARLAGAFFITGAAAKLGLGGGGSGGGGSGGSGGSGGAARSTTAAMMKGYELFFPQFYEYAILRSYSLMHAFYTRTHGRTAQLDAFRAYAIAHVRRLRDQGAL